MKTHIKLTYLIVVVLAAVLGFTFTSRAAVLLDDTWADGSRAEQNLPTESAWYGSRGPALSATANSMTLSVSTTSVMVLTYFTSNTTNPVQLAVGDTLTARFTLTLSKIAPVNKSEGLRLGVFNFGESTLTPKRVSADKFSTSSQGNGVNGYALFQNVGATFKPTPMDIRKHTTLNFAILSTSDEWTSLGTGPDSTAGFPGFAEGTPYVLQFALQRTATNAMVIGTSWSNTVSGATLATSATDNVATNFHFDGIAIRSAGASSTAAKIVFNEMKVELTPAATPAATPAVTPPAASKHP